MKSQNIAQIFDITGKGAIVTGAGMGIGKKIALCLSEAGAGVLVADIDRGGVFAQIIGTLEVLPREERNRIRGLIINRFRGDAALFKEGIDYIKEATRLPVLGLIPYFRHIEIDSEDGLPLEAVLDPPDAPKPDRINIAVLRLPHISNFTDFAPFERDPAVDLHYLAKLRPLEGYSHVFLPGSKNVIADTRWLQENGWSKRIIEYVTGGGLLGGICGGYQILGVVIRDPHGVEGPQGETPGLGLLNIETELRRKKELSCSSGVWEENSEPVKGYEIHMGITNRRPGTPGVIRVTARNSSAAHDLDGARTPDGKVWGTYFQGLFDAPGFRHTFLKNLQPDYRPERQESDESRSAFRDRQYDLLAEHFRAHLDMASLLDIVSFESE